MGLKIQQWSTRSRNMADRWVSDARHARTDAQMVKIAERIRSEWGVPRDEWKFICTEVNLRSLRWAILWPIVEKEESPAWDYIDKKADLAFEIMTAKGQGIGLGMQHEFEREQAEWKRLERQLRR